MSDDKKPTVPEPPKADPAKPVPPEKPKKVEEMERPALVPSRPATATAVQRQADLIPNAQRHLRSRLQGSALVVEAWMPNNALSQDPPAKTDVVIVGAGYGGLSTALELRRNGIGAVVLERGVFGIGASTRNGGMISGGTNVAKGLGGREPEGRWEFEANKAAFLASGADLLQTLIDLIQRENIDCGLITNGRFTGAWTPAHYDDQARKVEMFNKYANVGAEMIPRERVREMMASELLLRRRAM